MSKTGIGKSVNAPQKVMTVFLGLLAAQFVSSMSNTIIANAMPVIVAQIGGNAVQYTWVITAGILANIITTPVIGKLADLFDKKRLFIASLIIFATASLLSGASQSANQLIASRVLQGIGMGVLNGYRDNLNKTKEVALKYAGNLNFDTNYDTSKYQQDIMNMVNQYQGSMQNDLNLASAGHNFFDVNSLLGKAGSLQGYNNSPQTNPAGGVGQTNPLANLTDNKDNLLTSNNSNLIF